MVATSDGAAKAQSAVNHLACIDSLPCVCHMINQVVKDEVEDKLFRQEHVVGLLKKCQVLAALFGHSEELASRLAQKMTSIYAAETPIDNDENDDEDDDEELRRPLTVRLEVIDSARWFSTYLMLDSIMKCENGIREVLTRYQ